MSNDTNRKGPSEQSDNVWHTTYIQNPALTENSDVQHEIDLYYTDLDPLAKAELFMDESGAVNKAKYELSFFPTECFELISVYYTFDNNNNKIDHYQKNIPKGNTVNDSSTYQRAGCRRVTRRHLKNLYDQIDFIRVKRPMNTIKWYTISREELSNFISIMQEFYGLTNFPEKTGDYYFSKKIGKWLATDILKKFEENGGQYEIVDWDRVGQSGAAPRTVQRTLFDRFFDFLKGLGVKIFGFLGGLFDKDKWDGFIDTVKDGTEAIFNLDDNTLLNGTWDWDTLFGGTIKLKNIFPIGRQGHSEDNGNTVLGLLGGIGTTIGDKINDLLGLLGGNNQQSSIADKLNWIKQKMAENYNFKFTDDNDNPITFWDGITSKFNSVTQGINSIFNTSASWWNKTLWNKIAQKIIDLLHLNIDIDNTPDN